MDLFLMAYIANLCLEFYMKYRAEKVEVLKWKRSEF